MGTPYSTKKQCLRAPKTNYTVQFCHESELEESIMIHYRLCSQVYRFLVEVHECRFDSSDICSSAKIAKISEIRICLQFPRNMERSCYEVKQEGNRGEQYLAEA